MNIATSYERERKAQLGQFMTAPNVAEFMACLLVAKPNEAAHILDAGAGTGGLSCALIDVWGVTTANNVALSAFEVDSSVLPALHQNLAGKYADNFDVIAEDYIEYSVSRETRPGYTHAILNPPYKKISSQSRHRQLLRQVGIETGNLYSAFVSLALRDLKPNGQLVAIIPRSFCNGPYFKPFRQYILGNAALTHIHLFGSRTDAFKDDGVLQENIIVRLVKGQKQESVEVSVSNDSSFSDLSSERYDFSDIVKNDDQDQFIHIPNNEQQIVGIDHRVTLADLGLTISTGPVVGFRLREHLCEEMQPMAAPLLYPIHFRDGRVRWPLVDGKKPNGIAINEETRKWLYPNGNYCVIRRFSSKEERHRVVASVVEPGDIGKSEFIGLDNKLNFFHEKKATLSRELAHGLAAYLNTDLVDTEFRLFSGHTQVNATDLRKMTYPKRSDLEALGAKVLAGKAPTQDEIYQTFIETD